MPTHNISKRELAQRLYEYTGLIESHNGICHKLVAEVAIALCNVDYDKYASVNPTLIVTDQNGKEFDKKFLELYPDNKNKNLKKNGKRRFINTQWQNYIDIALERLTAQLTDPKINQIIKDEIFDALLKHGSLKKAPSRPLPTV